jgi:hypothetical protein
VITYTSTETVALELLASTGWTVLPDGIAREIEQLHCGTVILTVPLLDGVIQVGAADALPAATIEVRRYPSAVVVRRTDGEPLQAQIIRSDDDGMAVRAHVFTEPVPELAIRRITQRPGNQLWLVASGDRVRRSADLVQLIKTIVAFGVAKQRRIAHPAPLVASA